MTYRPRRCSKRWLDGDCPAEVLAICDSGPQDFDRYTVFYTDTYLVCGATWVSYRGMSEHPSHPQGFGIYGDMEAHRVAAYRYRTRYVKWSELPPDVQACVRRDCAAIRAA